MRKMMDKYNDSSDDRRNATITSSKPLRSIQRVPQMNQPKPLEKTYRSDRGATSLSRNDFVVNINNALTTLLIRVRPATCEQESKTTIWR